MKLRSKAWDHFEPIKVGKKIVKARCKYSNCHKILLAGKGYGTTSLQNHTNTFHKGKVEIPESSRRPRQGRRRQRDPSPTPSAPSSSPGSGSGEASIAGEGEPGLQEDEAGGEPAVTVTQKPIKTEPAVTATQKPIKTEPAVTAAQKPIKTKPEYYESNIVVKGKSAQDGDGAHLQNNVKLAADQNKIVCEHLSLMMVSHGCDSSLLEDINFRNLVKSLTMGLELPLLPRSRINEMCDNYCKIAIDGIFSEQRKSNSGRASLAVGTVRVEAGEVMYTACSLIDSEWNLRRVVTGAHVAVPLATTSTDFCGSKALLGLGQPEKSPDKVLNEVVLGDISKHGRVHGVFMPQGIKDDLVQSIKDAKPQTTGEPICWTYVDDVLHSVAQCLVPEELPPISQQMRTNMITLERCTQNLPYPGLDYPRSYHKKWYSLYCSLKILRDNNDDSTAHDEPALNKLLLKIWGRIHEAIQKISNPSCPTSNLCLKELLELKKLLCSELKLQEEAAKNQPELELELQEAAPNNHHAAVAALANARDTLEEAIEESYMVWSIPFVLDPRCKENALRSILEEAYDEDVAQVCTSKVISKIKELCRDEYFLSSRDHVMNRCKFFFTVTDYLTEDDAKYKEKCSDILEWWKKQMEGQKCKDCKNSKLGQLARDVLAMPTCSLLSSQQISQVRSIIRHGHSKAATPEDEDEDEGEELVVRKSGSSSTTKK